MVQLTLLHNYNVLTNGFANSSINNMFVLTLKMMRLFFLMGCFIKNPANLCPEDKNQPICLDLVLSSAAASCFFRVNSWFVLK